MTIHSVYDDLEVKGSRLRIQRGEGNRGDIYATVVFNNKGRHTFKWGTIVNKTAPWEEAQTRIWVWPFGPTKKEVLMLHDTELPRTVNEVDFQILFFDRSKERGLSVGGKIFDVNFKGAEVEYFD